MTDEPATPAIPAKPARAVRHDGWTDDRKAALIEALRRRVPIAAIAASLGMSRRSVYRLRDRPGGEDVAAAWPRFVVVPHAFFDDIFNRSDTLLEARINALSGAGIRRELRAEFRRARRRDWAAARRAKARANGVAR